MITSIDLGHGWVPAVLESETEHDFREADRGVSDIKSYWIDGSSNRTSFDFPYSDYFPDRSSGIKIYVHIS